MITQSLAKGAEQVQEWFCAPDTAMNLREAMLLDIFTRMRQMCPPGYAFFDLPVPEEVGFDEEGRLTTVISGEPYLMKSPAEDQNHALSVNLETYSQLTAQWCVYLPLTDLDASPLLEELSVMTDYDLNEDDMGRFIVPRLMAGYTSSSDFLEGYQSLEECWNPGLRTTRTTGKKEVDSQFRSYPQDVKIQMLIRFFKEYADSLYIGDLEITTDPDGSHPFLLIPPNDAPFDYLTDVEHPYYWWRDVMERTLEVDSYEKMAAVNPVLGELYFCAGHYTGPSYDSLGISRLFGELLKRLDNYDPAAPEKFTEGRESSVTLYERTIQCCRDYLAMSTEQRAEMWLDFFRNTRGLPDTTPPQGIHTDAEGHPHLEVLPMQKEPIQMSPFLFAVLLLEAMERMVNSQKQQEPRKDSFQEVIEELRLLRGADPGKEVYQPLTEHIDDPETNVRNFFRNYRSSRKAITRFRNREWQEIQERLGAAVDLRVDSRGLVMSERSPAGQMFTAVKYAIRRLFRWLF